MTDGSLGRSFPEEEREAYVNRSLRPGRIIYLFCNFTNPAKEKYLLLAHFGSSLLLFIINSEVPGFIRRDSQLCSCQVQLAAAEYNFLDHDSHLDCSNVITAFDGRAIRNQLLADVSRVKGVINAKTKRQILRVVTGAYTISPVHESMILNSLQRPHSDS